MLEFRLAIYIYSMKKTVLSVLLIVLLTPQLFSQNKMIINEFGGSTYYDDFSRDIYSLDKLPHVIVSNIKNLLKTSLGEFSSNVKFYNGQIVNLRKYLKHDTDTYNYQWILAKYDLNFNLIDTLIGIKNYPLKIRVDEYGQIIEINWPRKGCGSRGAFISRDSIKAFVLKQATKLAFNQKNYKVEFMYDTGEQKFLWFFLFPLYPEPINLGYNCVQVNWRDTSDFKVYKTRRDTLH